MRVIKCIQRGDCSVKTASKISMAIATRKCFEEHTITQCLVTIKKKYKNLAVDKYSID